MFLRLGFYKAALDYPENRIRELYAKRAVRYAYAFVPRRCVPKCDMQHYAYVFVNQAMIVPPDVSLVLVVPFMLLLASPCLYKL